MPTVHHGAVQASAGIVDADIEALIDQQVSMQSIPCITSECDGRALRKDLYAFQGCGKIYEKVEVQMPVATYAWEFDSSHFMSFMKASLRFSDRYFSRAGVPRRE